MNIIDIFEDMQLQVVVKTTATCDVVLRGRYVVEATGVIQFMNVTVTPSVTDGSSNTSTVLQLPKGKLLSLDVSTPTTGIQRGQLAVSCGLLRDGSGSTPFVRLMSGYITSFKGIDLNSGFEDTLSGVGYVSLISLSDPVGGDPALYTVPSNLLIKCLSAKMQLVTSAVVGNRVTYVKNSTNSHYLGLNNTSQTASKDGIHTFGINLSSVSEASTQIYTNPLSNCFFFGGDELELGAIGIDGGDQIYASIVAEVWIKN